MSRSGGRSGGSRSTSSSRSSGGRSSSSRSSGGRSSSSRSSGGRSSSSGGRSSSRSSSSSGRSSRSTSSSYRGSSSRASSSSFGGSSFVRSSPRIHNRPVFINYNKGGGGLRTGRASGAGCSTTVVTAVIIMIIVFTILIILSNSYSNGDLQVTKSTIERVALPKGSVNETGYYTDELGWIGNRTKLEMGLKNFYNKTGVQPYIYITDTVNGTHYPDVEDFEIFANHLYDELFTDEAHLLFIFLEYNDEYTNFYLCGTQAKTVIDNEAADILLDYIDRYYYDSSLSEEEFFSKSFSEAADRIMTVTRSPWSYFFIVVGVLIIVIVLFRWWQKSKEQKNLEREQRDKILNTPLGQFGSTEAEELAKKYEQKDSE